MKSRIPLSLCAATLAVLTLLLGSCGQSVPLSETTDDTAPGITSAAETGETPDDTPAYTDATADYDASSATALTFSESNILIRGSGATADGTTATITESGTYLLDGSCDNGALIIEGKKIQVQLVLNGLTLTNATCPAIFVKKAGSVILTLADGSENTLSDGTSYQWEDDGSSTPDAAIFSRSDLVINGSGSLAVSGEYAHGIVSKDTLTVNGGSLTVTAVKAALTGKDSVTVNGGTLHLTAGSDGIRADNDEDSTLGTVGIFGGSLTIIAGNDGIQAETALTVEGGSIVITAGGGSNNATPKTDSGFGSGRFPFWQTESTDESESMKGLKAGGLLTVSGGEITVDSADDSLHTNGNLLLSGGNLLLLAGDDGIHADGTLTVSGGKTVITKCYEGLEGSQIVLSGGNVSLTASDDGINASAASGTFAQADITISGGYYRIDAAGDGVDTNGTLHMSGGILLVSGPTNAGNGALDYETSATLTGGTVMALGSSGMAMNFSSSENQASILTDFASQPAGTSLSLCDADGNVIVSFTPSKAYASATVSAPGIAVGETYTLIAGGTVTGADENGFASSGSVSGGSTVSQITVSALISGSGSGFGGGQGGFGGQTFPGGQGGHGGRTAAGGTYPFGG